MNTYAETTLTKEGNMYIGHIPISADGVKEDLFITVMLSYL
jgi:hypothetical protein